jgi:hypothetical protein
MQVGNWRFQDFHVAKNENLGISNFLPALRIRAISSDRDLFWLDQFPVLRRQGR